MTDNPVLNWAIQEQVNIMKENGASPLEVAAYVTEQLASQDEKPTSTPPVGQTKEEKLEYWDVLLKCSETKAAIRQLTQPHHGIELADVKKESTQLEKVALYYVSMHSLINMLKERHEVAKTFLKQHIDFEDCVRVQGFEVRRSKPKLELDKEVWAELLKTDPEVLSAVTAEKHAKKKVKELKDSVSEFTGSSITWKVLD